MTANLYVHLKVEVNTEIFDGQLYQLIRRSGITVCRSYYPLSRDVYKEDKVGDKSSSMYELNSPYSRTINRRQQQS